MGAVLDVYKRQALVSVNSADRPLALEAAAQLHELGFSIVATEGTGRYLEEHGVPCRILKKLQEGRPNIYDCLLYTSKLFHLPVLLTRRIYL